MSVSSKLAALSPRTAVVLALMAVAGFSLVDSQSAPSNRQTSMAEADAAPQAEVRDAYGKLPLRFEANWGQTDAEVKFLSRGSGYTLFLAATEASLALRKPAAPEADEREDNVGLAGVTTLPEGTESRRAFEILDSDFSGGLLTHEQYTPYVLAFVLGLSFILWLVLLRSMVVPLKALA